MQATSHSWVIVLAGGSGTRLAELTTGRDGVAVPKQFCSLRGGRSLLLDTLSRAHQLVPRERIVVVVAAEHERWWRPQLRSIDAENILVQPANRGTCAGILLPLLHIHARDPHARVALLPSDHWVESQRVLHDAMQRALANVAVEPEHVVLLGITPDCPDPELGWIVPAAPRGNLPAVAAFVEKPELPRAAALMHQGALWNSFLLAGSSATLLGLCRQFAAPVTAQMLEAFAFGRLRTAQSLAEVYAGLPILDFSRSVLQHASDHLRLLPVPECGWTDLGTPHRVADCIARIERSPARALSVRAPWFDTVDLARALRARQAAMPLARPSGERTAAGRLEAAGRAAAAVPAAVAASFRTNLTAASA